MPALVNAPHVDPATANPASALAVLDDKLALREVLAYAGMPTVKFERAEHPAQVRAALGKLGYPAVLRPAELAGGRGVYLVGGPQHLQGWSAMLGRYNYSGPVLVEEYLRGPQFTVATMSRAGVHEVVGIAGKDMSLPPLFVEMGHVYPAPLPSEQAQAMGELAAAALRACGYHTGPAHVDIVWTEDGPKVVGAHARPAGDRISRLAALATGVDLEHPTPRSRAGTAAISYFWLPSGELESVAGLDLIRALPYVDELVFPFQPGDRVPETTDAKSRHGHVIVAAGSAQQAAERIAEVRSLLAVGMRPRSALGAVPRPRAAS